MGTELVNLDPEKLKELVAALPVKKRAAFSKAAKAAIQHLRDSKANYSKTYGMASAMVENWWRLGIEIPKLIKKGKPVPGQLKLEDLGINISQSARCQKLAEKSKAEIDAWLEEKYDEENYYLPSLRPASESGHVHVGENSGAVEWYTPPEFIAAARAVLGTIDLDPASSKTANKNVKATTYFDASQNGLEQEWSGNVWMNPPYSSGLVDKFMAKLAEEIDSKRVSSAISLTNNSTDTAWFGNVATRAAAMCTVQGRIKYLDESLTPANSPLQGQVFLYFGKALRKFANNFNDLGIVWIRT